MMVENNLLSEATVNTSMAELSRKKLSCGQLLPKPTLDRLRLLCRRQLDHREAAEMSLRRWLLYQAPFLRVLQKLPYPLHMRFAVVAVEDHPGHAHGIAEEEALVLDLTR
jgi:hypothetical protein